MTYTESHNVTLIKLAKRNLRPEVITEQFNGLLGSMNTKSLKVQGWTLHPTVVAPGDAWTQAISPDPAYKYSYALHVTVQYEKADGSRPGRNDLPAIVRQLNTRASNPQYGVWEVGAVDGETYKVDKDADFDGNATDQIGYTEIEIPENWSEHFAHLYGLDAHVRRIRKSIEAGQNSGWRNRFHSVLIGPPGCGKSDICKSLKGMLGEDAVFEFDGTSTTAAGAIKMLSEIEILPRIIIIEEIEKAPEVSMQFLLGVLDLRGEIRKTTARKDIQRATKLLAIATVNNE